MTELEQAIEHAVQQRRTVHERIVAIREELPAIGKDNTIQGGGPSYKYRSIEHIKAALAPLLAKHGVFYVPVKVLKSKRRERAYGSRGTLHNEAVLRVKFRIYGKDGTHVTAVGEGEGLDSSDKATNKAHTGAEKNMLIELFCIGDGAADPDHERPGDDEGPTPVEQLWERKQAKGRAFTILKEGMPELEARGVVNELWETVGPDGEGPWPEGVLQAYWSAATARAVESAAPFDDGPGAA